MQATNQQRPRHAADAHLPLSVVTSRTSTARSFSDVQAHTALSPIYPIRSNVNDVTYEDSDCSSDPTFRPSLYYRTRSPRQAFKHKQTPRRKRRSRKRPLGMPEINFYPRNSSTPKDDDYHKRYCRFSAGYQPVYRRHETAHAHCLNDARLYSSVEDQQTPPVTSDVYAFEPSEGVNAVPSLTTPQKRGRGRPRKYPLSTTSNSRQCRKRDSSQAKRGRGRPPKRRKLTSSTRVNVRESTRVDVRESTRVDVRE